MDLYQRFSDYLFSQQLCQPQDQILLAVSGGRDSVLMAHLFASAGYPFGIAHCNFQLRGDASDKDEQLVATLAKGLEVPLYIGTFDTKSHAQQQGMSIQMAARELRYQWFEEIRSSQGYQYVAIAQHQLDNVETVLLNLVRGTGLAGLHGILPKRGHIIRPLLFLSADEVHASIDRLKLEYRDDESNFSTKYARNKIRLEVIPKLKELNPDLERTFANNIRHFSDAHELVQAYIGDLRNKLFVEQKSGEYHIAITALSALQPNMTMLYELFKPYGFSTAVLGDLERTLNGVSGKQFLSNTHVIYLDRSKLVLKRLGEVAPPPASIHAADAEIHWSKYRFKATISNDTVIDANPNVAKFDAEKITFPIQIRSWQEGDRFRPLGMKGKKKLSDYFVSLKLPVFEKKNVPVVVNANGDIMWVAPYQIDDRYKITDKTKKVLTLACY